MRNKKSDLDYWEDISRAESELSMLEDSLENCRFINKQELKDKIEDKKVEILRARNNYKNYIIKISK